MKTPLSWIKAYVPDLEVTNQEYIDAMTLSGTKVEGCIALDADLDKIVVGQLQKIEGHPDADKLVVCQVDVGSETIQIVTGAQNVREGQKIPVVLVGGRIAGGTKIKKGKLRGVESAGMLCSIEELGSNREMYPDAPEDGIYILNEDAKVGEDAVALLGLRDSVFEYEVTSNRVDCFAVLGIAREAAATFGKPFVPPVIKVKADKDDISSYFSVEVQDGILCPRFCARMIKNIRIAPSPEWMQRRLAAAGIRPINNIVDITNYVMEEFGQPMHAYDMDTLAGSRIVVKRAKNGDTFQTLDGVIRELDEEMLMICDGEKAVGIAGIMGGENSKIRDDVNTIIFESACFDGTNVRLSSKRLGMRTDASGKFEKGLDPQNTSLALDRACQLIEELGVGEVVGGMIDIDNSIRKEIKILFEPDKINALLGTCIEERKMLEYLARIGLQLDPSTREIIVPSFRQDLECLADLAEEVARFFGYDNIPTTLPGGEMTVGRLSAKLRIEGIVRNVVEYSGFSEGMCYSFESPKVFDKLLIPQGSELREAVVIMNPLGEDYSIMRTISLNGILTSLATNYNHRNKDVRLYELGNIYLPKELPVTQLPEERMQLTLGMYGSSDFFDLKGVVEEILERLGMNQKTVYEPKADKSFLHPKKQADIIYGETLIGFIGEVHPEVTDNYGIKERTCIAVLDMPRIYGLVSFERKYAGVPKYPAVTRDLSMVVPKEIFVSRIEEIFEKRGGKLLESCRLFDIYEGAQIKENYKSVAYSAVFRASDRTLEDKEISEIMDKIIEDLKAVGIELRG